MLAEKLEGVTPFDQADALADQPFELDRLDLGAILLVLALALCLLVAFKLALDAVDLAVEQVDKRSEQVGEIVLQARVVQHCAESVDRSAEVPLDSVGFGQWPRSGIAPAGPQQRGGWRGAAILFRDAKPGLPGGGKWLTRAIATRSGRLVRPALPADRPLGKAAGAAPFIPAEALRPRRPQPFLFPARRRATKFTRNRADA
jgi:hypothetical protein